MAFSDAQLVFTVQKAEPQLANAEAGSKTKLAAVPSSAGIMVFICRHFLLNGI